MWHTACFRLYLRGVKSLSDPDCIVDIVAIVAGCCHSPKSVTFVLYLVYPIGILGTVTLILVLVSTGLCITFGNTILCFRPCKMKIYRLMDYPLDLHCTIFSHIL